MTACKLANHEIVSRRLIRVQRLGKLCVSMSEVVDPYGRIDKDHDERERRRRGTRNCGSVPANRASRRALSLWMSASSASRNSALRSLTPLNVWACCSKASSRFTVVRILIAPTGVHQL